MCDCCQNARTNPQWTQHCPSCAFCGARLIQNILRLPIARSEASERAKAALKVWTDYGHPEIEIRRMVKLKTPPLAESSTAPPKRGK